MVSATLCSVYQLTATSTPVDTQEHATHLILKLAIYCGPTATVAKATLLTLASTSLLVNYPTFIQNIAGGVIYLATNEHTIPNPLYKGSTYPRYQRNHRPRNMAAFRLPKRMVQPLVVNGQQQMAS